MGRCQGGIEFDDRKAGGNPAADGADVGIRTAGQGEGVVVRGVNRWTIIGRDGQRRDRQHDLAPGPDMDALVAGRAGRVIDMFKAKPLERVAGLQRTGIAGGVFADGRSLLNDVGGDNGIILEIAQLEIAGIILGKRGHGSGSFSDRFRKRA